MGVAPRVRKLNWEFAFEGMPSSVRSLDQPRTRFPLRGYRLQLKQTCVAQGEPLRRGLSVAGLMFCAVPPNKIGGRNRARIQGARPNPNRENPQLGEAGVSQGIAFAIVEVAVDLHRDARFGTLEI